MTQKIRAYKNWQEESDDRISEWFWTQVGRFIIAGVLISLPGLAVGIVRAPEGTNRLQQGLSDAATTHGFLWGSAAVAVGAVVDVVAPILDNGSSQEQSQ